MIYNNPTYYLLHSLFFFLPLPLQSKKLFLSTSHFPTFPLVHVIFVWKYQDNSLTLTSSKILSLDNKNKMLAFVLYCARLFVSL